MIVNPGILRDQIPNVLSVDLNIELVTAENKKSEKIEKIEKIEKSDKNDKSEEPWKERSKRKAHTVIRCR